MFITRNAKATEWDNTVTDCNERPQKHAQSRFKEPIKDLAPLSAAMT